MRINPTVSVRSIFCFPFPLLYSNALVVVSSVAKSLSSANISAPVNVLRSVDFPTFVYPTIAKTGVLPVTLSRLVNSLLLQRVLVLTGLLYF